MKQKPKLIKQCRKDLQVSLVEIEEAIDCNENPPEDEIEHALGTIGVVLSVLDD